MNSLSRLMQTFGANIVTCGASRSTLGKPGSGSWHTAQGILGIVTKDKATGNPTFTNKYIREDAIAYGERIGQIASFFQNNYNKSMGLPAPQTGKTCKEFAQNVYLADLTDLVDLADLAQFTKNTTKITITLVKYG